MWKGIVGVFAVLVLAASVRAQALADRAPADAIFYMGGVGADAIGQADKGTHLQGILDHSDLQALVNQFLPQALDKIGVDAPDAATATKLAQEIVPPLWHHPHALIFAGINQQQRLPRIALLCQAGPDADKLFSAIDDALKQAPIPVKPAVARDGDLIVVSVGFDKPEDAFAAAGAESLATQRGFKDALAQVDANGMSDGYLDVPKLFKLIDALPPGAQQIKAMAPMVISALGLDDIKAIAVSQNFDGKDWTEKAFVAAPAPRSGLLSLGDKPMDPSIFKLAPSTSTRVIAHDLDLSQLLTVIRDSAAKINPNVAQTVDQVLDQANQATGVNVQYEVLGSFGSDWLAYTDPETAGEGGLGLVVVNRPRNSDKLQAALGKLEQFADSMSSGFLQDKHIEVQIRQTTIDGVTIHYLGAPLFEPAWAIKDGVWYFALYPSIVSTAADGNPDGKSILDNPSFAELAGRLGHQADATGLQFLDVPKLAPESYPGWLLLSRVAGAGDLLGVPAPVTLLPKYRDLMANLTPVESVAWRDAAGLHARSIEAFPGSSIFGSESFSLSSLSSQATSFSALLPALTKAREQANRAKSQSNLHQIGLGAIMYSNGQKDGSFPDSLSQLMDSQQLPPIVFVNPRTNTSPPRHLAKDQLDAWVDNDSDYVWVGKGKKTTAASDEVLAYEKPRGLKEGINILFADGHVEFEIMPVAEQKIPGLDVGPARHKAPPSDGGL
jgi:prepilin-type processing-associated H-X9-DG protein